MSENKIPTEILEDDDEVIVLMSADGEEVEFVEIAGINLHGKFFAILQPVELLEDMTEEDCLVFEVTPVNDEEDKFDLVTDDKIIDAVFAEYEKLLAENE